MRCSDVVGLICRILEAGVCRSVALRRIRLQGVSVGAYIVRSATLCFFVGSDHLSFILLIIPFISSMLVAAMARDVVKYEASQEDGCQSSTRVKLLADIRYILGNCLMFTKSLAS